jgi:phosphohistidine phosphatase SixA
MQTLSVLRHAKAVTWTPSADDFSRELQAVGRKHAHRIAEWMCEHLELPDCILCSPSQRTRETLIPLLSMQAGLETVTNFLPQLYHSNLRTLQAALDAAFAESDRVLVVGHNPGLETLVADVIQRKYYPEFSRLPTGTLVVIDFTDGWDQNKGDLRQLIRGKYLSSN